jgi:hypothetical protein
MANGFAIHHVLWYSWAVGHVYGKMDPVVAAGATKPACTAHHFHTDTVYAAADCIYAAVWRYSQRTGPLRLRRLR